VNDMDINDDAMMAARIDSWRKATDDLESLVGPRPAPTPFFVALRRHAKLKPRLAARTLSKEPHQNSEPVSDSPLELDLLEIGVQLRDGRLSVGELTELAAERLCDVHQRTNAIEQLDIEGARIRVSEIEAQRKAMGTTPNSPLWGVPMAHKSLTYRDSFPSACGSHLGDLLQPQPTATTLKALERAGSINLGQLHMTELAFDPTGVNACIGDCRNPWQSDYIPGGSSSGSAVAVATRCVFGALGSDTAGSIRIPSALCGVTGLKPTYGQVSRHGTMPLSGSHDHIGPLARTARDCALIFHEIAGPDTNDPTTAFVPSAPLPMPALAALDGVHVGVPMRFFRDGLDAQIRKCLDESLKVFERAGAMVKEVPDFPYEEINALSSMMIRVEAGAAHQRALAAHPVRYSVELAGWLQQAGGVPAMLYEKAHHLRGELLKQYLTTVMKDVHVLHVPVMRLPTPSLEEARQNGTAADQVRIELTRLTRPFSYFGLPALSLPCGYAKTSAGDELPTAFQLIGHPFDDARLLGIGAFYQRVTDWHKHRPPLFSGRDDLGRPTPRGDQ